MHGTCQLASISDRILAIFSSIRLPLTDERGEFAAIVSPTVVADLCEEALEVLHEQSPDPPRRPGAHISALMRLQDSVEVVHEEIWLMRHNEPSAEHLFCDT
jgi:hypothetical protein